MSDFTFEQQGTTTYFLAFSRKMKKRNEKISTVKEQIYLV